MGSISYAFSVLGYCGKSGQVWRDRVKECLDFTRNHVLKARDTSIIEGGLPIIKWGLVLRVIRGVLEENRMPSSIEEFKGFLDAMVREFAISRSRTVLVIPRGGDSIDLLKRALWLMGRFGNSESWASTISVTVTDAERCDDRNVNVIVKYDQSRISGGFTVVKATDEVGNEYMFALPVTSGSRGDVYYPSVMSYGGDTLCARLNGVNIVFPSGDDW
ncbi:type I-A CRISPR-associated protein Cas5a [Vulcanisaeta sp. JCM 16159]|uniref:type I-A CRISPR-associated protein Cas5a n=1 Tax=Vulcanisaeta sp. JCM 16159 TaxID=1295371 RepID=UPI003466200E